MSSRGLLRIVFGKERGITKEDVEAKIIDIGFKESVSFECKTFKNITKIEDENKEKQIIAPLIAFMNKFITEGGILILGVDCKNKLPSKIIPIEEKLIKGENQLLSWITNNISSIPLYYAPPTIEIEEVTIAKSQSIFVIEIHAVDVNVVYFSKINECAYRRVVDETSRIPLIETLKLIEERRMPRVDIRLEQTKWEANGEFIIGSIKVVYNNLGNKPSRQLLSMFTFTFIEEVDQQIVISSVRFKDVTTINKGCIKAFQHELLHYPLYPNSPTVSGDFNVKFNKKVKIRINIESNEEMSCSHQQFMLSMEGITEEIPPQYRTYI